VEPKRIVDDVASFNYENRKFTTAVGESMFLLGDFVLEDV
jgi:hypothetical protein